MVLSVIDKDRIIAGRSAVDAYRSAHSKLHANGWYKGISEDHTPLLEKMIADLEKIGVTSAELDFEFKKTEVLTKFFKDSETLNLEELGLADKVITDVDRVTLNEKWK